MATCGPRWKGRVVNRQTGPVSYEIEVESATVVRRHVDHVKKRIGPDSNTVRVMERANTLKEIGTQTGWSH